MKIMIAASAALMISSSLVVAGGLDRSGQGIGALFEDGNYVELNFGYVMPNVSGTVGGGTVSSGDMAQDYLSFGLAVKQDFNDKLSFAVIFEQAFGAAIDYTNADAAYAAAVPPVTAELSGQSITALARYKLSDRFSVHGGARLVTMSGTIDLTGAGGPLIDYGNSSDVGYVVGGTFEIPDIALRASLTYSSATSHNNAKTLPDAGGVSVGETGAYTMPQSVNLDFQTGVAANTLLLASVRWAEWSETAIDTGDPLGLGIIDYNNDVYTYSLGVARRFSDTFAGVAKITYENSKDLLTSNLDPTDGRIGITLAGIYDVTDQMTITGGISYVMVGDSTTELVGANFSDNSAIGIGIKVGYTF